jgi:hypothetical protein
VQIQNRISQRQNVNTETLLIAMVGIAAFALLLQALVLLAMLFAINKTAKIAIAKVDEMRVTVVPLLDRSRELLEATHNLIARVEPRIDAAATDLAHITRAARSQVTQFESTANEIQDRVYHQVARIDRMATVVLDGVDRAGQAVASAVRGPARRVSGAFAAIKAFVETFGKASPRVEHEAVPHEHVEHGHID